MRVAEVPNGKRRIIYSGVELYRHTINNGFEPKNVNKVLVENHLREHYKKNKIWL